MKRGARPNGPESRASKTGLQPIATEVRTWVWIPKRAGQPNIRERVGTAERSVAEPTSAVVTQRLVVGRGVLQYVSVDRRREAVQRLRMQALSAGERVNPTLRVVNVRQRVRLGETTLEANALGPKAHVQECRLVIIMAGIIPEVVQLLTLEFVLDALAIRSVPNQRKHRSDSLNQHGPLRGISIVKRRLRPSISFETI